MKKEKEKRVTTNSGAFLILCMYRKITFDVMSLSSKLHAEKDNCTNTLEDHK
jgi:hypothetical protein